MIYLYKKHKARQAAQAQQRKGAETAPVQGKAGTPNRTETAPTASRVAEPSTTSQAVQPQNENKKLCPHQQHSNEAAVERPDASITNPAISAIQCSECKEEKRAARIYRWKLILALFPAQFLASIDVTVVSTALTTISSHFNQLQQFNWIVTAYTLTSTAFIPAYGQIADIWGRHAALQVSMAFMLVGSVLCAAAQTWAMLIFGRALQGLSAAGILNITKIVLADKVSLAANAKNTSIFSVVAGVSYSVGPVIGGYMAQINWRWVFVIQIPITVVAQVLIFVLLRKELVRGTHHITGPERKTFVSGLATIDIGGTFLFVVGSCLLILGVTWGGTQHPWGSYQVLVPLVIGAIIFLSFFVYEYLLEPGNLVARQFPKQVAMIPWKLFGRKDALLMAIVNAATGAALYSAFYFIGIFWTLVQNYSPGKAGTQLLYYTPGIGVGVYSAMFICNVFPRQTFYPLSLGSIIEAAGFAVLAWATQARNSLAVILMMALSGVGTGLRFMPNTLHMAGVWRSKLAAALSFMDFALPFGGTLGIAIMSSVFYNKFESSLQTLEVGSFNSASLNTHNNTNSLQGIRSLPEPVQELIREKAARAVMWSFISILPLMGLSILAACSLGNVWIKPRNSSGKEEVLYGSYLVALFKGQVKANKQPVVDEKDGGTELSPRGKAQSAAD